jgi:hypothetical protein
VRARLGRRCANAEREPAGEAGRALAVGRTSRDTFALDAHRAGAALRSIGAELVQSRAESVDAPLTGKALVVGGTCVRIAVNAHQTSKRRGGHRTLELVHARLHRTIARLASAAGGAGFARRAVVGIAAVDGGARVARRPCFCVIDRIFVRIGPIAQLRAAFLDSAL